MIDHTKFYINGEWVDPVIANPFEVINPANEQSAGTISMGSSADVDIAVAAAVEAFDSWSESSIDDRIALMEKFIELYETRAEEFAQLMMLEMGTPIRFSRNDQTPTGPGLFQSTIDAMKAHAFERPSMRGGSTLRDEAVGVCGLITPWNWPVNQVAAKVAPALGAGCTMVLKPSEMSPLSANLFAQILHEAGCPKGVFNLINGDGLGVGAPLSSHPDVDMVSFTGSTRAGKLITQASVDTVKRVALELGGKSPNICFADADLESAITYSVENVMSNSGQTCDAPTRLLVERSVYDEACAIAAKVANNIEVKSPEEDGDHIGPVVNKNQYDQIREMIQVGINEGATLIAGGLDRPEDLDKGYYIQPTVFSNVDHEMTIAKDEIFGPVLSIIPFDTEEQAIQMANDSPYGLAGFVQTGDPEKAMRVAKKLRAGTISINAAVYDYDVPFGGYKQSGNGRENGIHGLHDYLETKAITVA